MSILRWLPAVFTPTTEDLRTGTAGAKSSPSNWRYSTHQPLGLAEATEKLREDEVAKTLAQPKFKDIKTFVSRVPSQNPVEDRYSFGTIEGGDSQLWPFWAVFDGHSGWATAELLRKELAPYVSHELMKANGSPLTNDVIVSAITKAFTLLDEEILEEGIKALDGSLPHAEAMCRIAPASSGSCATMAFLDPSSKRVYVACAGDSRAVLGKKSDTDSTCSQQWTSEPLSIDQTGFNKAEVERILREHPGESPVDTEDGRVLNCAVTRSFGDNRWKWALKDLEYWQSYYFGRNPLSNYHSPPYLTAKPEIKSAEVNPGDFLVIASDGFWSHIESNDDAIHLVSMWIQEKCSSEPRKKAPKHAGEINGQALSENEKKDKKYTGYPYEFIVKRSDFLVEDDNPATHLARNAFGGKNRDLFCSLLSTTAPDSKEARDDLTVIVVLF